MNSVTFKVQLNRILFESDAGYKIINCFDVDSEENITLVGYFMPINEDEVYAGEGEIKHHPKFGKQIEVKTLDKVIVSDSEKLVDYFSSGLFFGIGEKTAQNIVDLLGDDAIAKILADDSVLLNVKNLSERKALKFSTKLKELNDTTNIFNYLVALGINQKNATKIYSQYGDGIQSIFEDDPFIIYYNNSFKYSFKMVHTIAKALTLTEDDVRMCAATLYNFIDISTFNTGNTYVEYRELDEKLINVDSAIEYLVEKKLVIVDGESIILKKMRVAEETIANFVKSTSKNEFIDQEISDMVTSYCDKHKLSFSKEQESAINNSIQNKVSVITGGPGTGKTTIISAICQIFMDMYSLEFGDSIFENELVLLAPTGRASKRMNEQTGLSAATIHRYLKWDKDKNNFEYNRINKAHAKVVIVDESSMIDTYLFASLIEALNLDTVMVIIGDDMQLPAVGCGDILNDLIASEQICVSTLNRVYRQDSKSLINFMHEVRNFNVPNDLGTNYEDRNFIQCKSDTINEYLKLVLNKILTKQMSVFDFQVLIPMYKGASGIDKVNLLCQEIFNPKEDSKKELKIGNHTFRVGDKVLVTRNFPSEGVYNGDLGAITDLKYSPTQTLQIKFDSGSVAFSGEDVWAITHGYAISIHKSQGSEFSQVIMPISLSYHFMLKHNLIYTGITRAKDGLLLIGEQSAFENAVCNHSIERRKTSLAKLLVSDVSPYDFL